MKFKLDTDAKITAISETTFHSLTDTTLKRPSKALHGPAHTPLKVIGQFTGNFKYNNSRCKLHVYVVKDLKTNLLGLPAISYCSESYSQSTKYLRFKRNNHETVSKTLYGPGDSW